VAQGRGDAWRVVHDVVIDIELAETWPVVETVHYVKNQSIADKWGK
jgi:hypothetical protein